MLQETQQALCVIVGLHHVTQHQVSTHDGIGVALDVARLLPQLPHVRNGHQVFTRGTVQRSLRKHRRRADERQWSNVAIDEDQVCGRKVLVVVNPDGV